MSRLTAEDKAQIMRDLELKLSGKLAKLEPRPLGKLAKSVFWILVGVTGIAYGFWKLHDDPSYQVGLALGVPTLTLGAVGAVNWLLRREN